MYSDLIEKMFCLSITHLSTKDKDDVHTWSGYSDLAVQKSPFRVIEHEYGYIIPIPSDLTREAASDYEQCGVSPDIVRAMLIARTCGCQWINFDRDASVINELPVYEW